MLAAQSSISNATGQVGRIPIRNLWLLMLYASELYRHTSQLKVSVEDNPEDLPNLVAEILTYSVEKRLHKNLSSGYRLREAELSRVRGKIDLLKTERHQLLAKGKVACSFEELTIDTPRNRFVLAALEMISKLVTLQTLAHRCRSLSASLKRLGVSGKCPTHFEISLDRFGRNDADDRFMVAAAKLAFDMAIPTESVGNSYLVAPDREEVWLRKLYEKAIGGFYKINLIPQGWQVDTGKAVRWQIEQKTSGIDSIFPTMKTDIILDKIEEGKRIVIDTKFTSILTSGWYREDSLRSGYIYQIYSYLMSQTGKGNYLDDNAAGLLLHPSVGKMVDETVTIQGHSIRFSTVDLSSSAKDMRQQLLKVINFQALIH
jgi:5-methylcytosine-specific restriction enzyme subunit McrC